jgi:hypothetical protein
MLGALLLVGSIAASPADAGPLVFADKVVAGGEVLTLGQVADLEVLPADLRQHAAVLPLLSRRRDGLIEHSQLASRARSLMPALAPWLRGPFEGRVAVFARNVPPAMPMASCDAGEGGVPKGEELTVRVTSGPFDIQRQATALQSAKPGERLSVRTADGAALAVQCEGVE